MRIDCHLHIYPFFNEKLLFQRLIQNLSIRGNEIIGGFLVERFDCFRFKELLSSVDVGSSPIKSIDSRSIKIEIDGRSVYLFSGRQIVTKERIEVLAYFVNELIPDGLSLQETVKLVDELNGVVGFSWAPGKWLGTRGSIILDLIKGYSGAVLCDSALRPVGWPQGKIFQTAHSLGIPVLAGSDPLPVCGEEIHAGSYGIEIPDNNINFETPTQSIQSILRARTLAPKIIGRRPDPFSWSIRYGRFNLKDKR